jgi:hypothetical protein
MGKPALGFPIFALSQGAHQRDADAPSSDERLPPIFSNVSKEQLSIGAARAIHDRHRPFSWRTNK